MSIKERSVLALFNEQVTRPIDRKFSEAVIMYVRSLARKSDRTRDHINFLGGNLIGVYPFKILDEDLYLWKNDILQINDFDKLQFDIKELPDFKIKNEKTGKVIQMVVASDAINLSFLWVVYKALTSTLSEKEKMMLAHAALMGLQYKLLSSLHTRRFQYPADEGIAQMVYESLDNNSQLKQYGNWQNMLDHRADDILGHDALHANTIRTLEPDRGLILALNDIQTRLRSLVQGLTDKYYDIKERQTKFITTSKFTIVEGEAILKDSLNQFSHIKSLMSEIVPDKNNFIREDLIDAVILTVKTAHKYHLSATLKFISENYLVRKVGKHEIIISELIDEILMFCLTLLKKENIHLTNVPEVAIKLKDVLSSSRFKSQEYADIKEKVDYLVEFSNVKINFNATVSTRIAVVFYICLRSLIK